MKIKEIRSDKIYQKMITAPMEKKNDIYRYELMQPFKSKWDCYHIPLKSQKEGGYDIIMASEMMGILSPSSMNESNKENIDLLEDDHFWNNCKEAIQKSFNCFTERGIILPVENYLFTILLANPKSPYVILSDGYFGDGGIPGYIIAILTPNQYTMERLPVALAHEANHNIRFQFEKWHNDISLYEMMIHEGIAENFATYLYGEDKVGPWVSKTEIETLNNDIKPIIYEGLQATGLENITAYLYGDELANLQNYFPVGLPYCAGYACGYHMIKYYLKKTGKNIIETTLISSSEIMKELEDFWN